MVGVFTLFASSCEAPVEIDEQFTIAVIPDTQNYLDFTRQMNEGFGINGADLFLEQMEYIAANTKTNGGEIEFVTSVGDVWQNYDRIVDPLHYERGMRQLPFPERLVSRLLIRTREATIAGVREFEVPTAIRGYEMIASTGVPFSVLPGNHDYDTWWWNDPNAGYSEVLNPRMHVGGYNTFNKAFGEDTPFFKDKDWYIGSFNGGVNSAQIFEAGGYKFLHFGFEMQPSDDVLEWAQTIIDQHPGLPTIMSTHDFLNPRGIRAPSSMDLAEDDPEFHNSAEDIWDKWIRKNDQIFMILSGHQLGQATRIDKNGTGHDVYQILSDYQARHMTAIPPLPFSGDKTLGDGWMRLMNFDFTGDVPKVDVRTYSTHYKKYSIEMPEYAQWYKEREQPEMTDEEFNAADHFTIELIDFKQRFGNGN